jgi:tetratricopeptide (TPR) repeat protein
MRAASFCLLAFLAVLPATLSSPAFCQDASTPAPASRPAAKDTPQRRYALELYHSGKFVEAMPLLEALSSADPSDIVVKEAWAYSIGEYAATLPDAETRKRVRARARSIAVEAQKLGDNSSLLQVLLDLPEDGGEPTFSSRKDVDDVMKAAEADFARGDLDKARNGYLHALLLDPNNYDAALFIGDVYFKQYVYGSAGEWFARAVQMDPNRETAYRYWGDVLRDTNRSAQARDKYIQAVVAEPYSRRSVMGLNDWAHLNKVTLNWVKLQDKGSVSVQDDSHININLDPNSPKKNDVAGTAWMTYSMNRALWHGDKFKKEFPNEPKYRRTMREEADSLHLMVTVMTEQKNFEKNKKNLEPSLQELVKIDQAGFIEPFALLNRADNDIAQDYAAYRNANRDKIYRYFDEYVVPKIPPQ